MHFFKAALALFAFTLGLAVAIPVPDDSKIDKPKTLVDYGIVTSIPPSESVTE
ncbi:hypothetical protein F4678DRAFT_462321 [Xylaria arbuscula]|nr:hypothetical protein F4678DRAFT_462321 [Xylaria arbuscula]